ncbi:hypothetical protein MFIFM68171_00097 [Madurella fahalii]|uniref:Vint domain-containing protein n=1 Tax=Madurella fahalii TaxID=1157608 RepID=A0ABQ0FWK2_9PEZI
MKRIIRNKMVWFRKDKSDNSGKQTQNRGNSNSAGTEQKDGSNEQGISQTGQFSWKCACGQDIPGDPTAHRCPDQEATEPSPLEYVTSLGVDGCIGGESIVRLAGGERRLVKDLKKGDLIECNADGDVAEVQCVMVQRATKASTPMVKIMDGVFLTPMHPVEINGTWALPKDVGDVRLEETDRVFNFLLDNHHTIRLDGVTCAVLGHQRSGLTSHPFWGCWEKVSKCMWWTDSAGFEAGLVEISGTVRNQIGTVYGLKDMKGNPVI